MKPIYTILFFSVLIIGSLIAIDKNCQDKNCQDKIVQVDRAYIIDSVKTVQLTQKIEIQKALQAAEKIITEGLKPQIKVLKETVKVYVWKYRTDTVKSLPCDSALIAYEALVDTLDKEAESYSKQLYLCEQQSAIKDTIITNKTKLIDTYQCRTEWKVKHRFWAWVIGYKCK